MLSGKNLGAKKWPKNGEEATLKLSHTLGIFYPWKHSDLSATNIGYLSAITIGKWWF